VRGGSPSAPKIEDAAAAAAFHAHELKLAASGDVTIAGMFSNADPNDPLSSLVAANSATPYSIVPSRAGALASAETLHDMLAVTGRTLLEESASIRDQLKELDTTILAPFRSERDKEAGLGEAVARRDGAIDRVREANNSLARKKKTMLSLKPSEKDYASKMTLAQAAVDKADAALTARKAELDKMTTVLKVRLSCSPSASSLYLKEWLTPPPHPPSPSAPFIPLALRFSGRNRARRSGMRVCSNHCCCRICGRVCSRRPCQSLRVVKLHSHPRGR
jgi:hypothetical protein